MLVRTHNLLKPIPAWGNWNDALTLWHSLQMWGGISRGSKRNELQRQHMRWVARRSVNCKAFSPSAVCLDVVHCSKWNYADCETVSLVKPWLVCGLECGFVTFRLCRLHTASYVTLPLCGRHESLLFLYFFLHKYQYSSHILDAIRSSSVWLTVFSPSFSWLAAAPSRGHMFIWIALVVAVAAIGGLFVLYRGTLCSNKQI